MTNAIHELQPIDGKTATREITRPTYRVPVGQARPAAGISMALLWSSFFRWWWIITPIGLVCAGIGMAIFWNAVPPKYKATAWVKIENRKPSLVFNERAAATDAPVFIRTQIELIRSPLVVGLVLGQPDVVNLPEVRAAGAPRNWVTSRIQVRSVGNSELFQISFDGHTATSAVTITNAVLDNYLKIQSELVDEQTERLIELLEQEKQKRAADLQRIQRNLKVLAKEASGKDPAAARGANIVAVNDPTGALQDRLTTTEVDLELQQARAEVMRKNLAGVVVKVPDALLTQLINELPEVQYAETALGNLRAELVATEAIVAKGRENPRIVRLKAHLQDRQNALAKMRNELRKSKAEEYQAAVRTNQEAQLEELDADIANQLMVKELLTKRLASKRTEMSDVGDQSLDLQYGKAELERAEHVYEQVADRCMELRTEMRAPARVTQIERASEAETNIEKTYFPKLGICGLGCLCLPFGIAVLYEFRTKRITNSRQLCGEGEPPLLGEITMLPASATQGSPRSVRSLQAFHESVEHLRISLTMPEFGSRLQTFAVASATSGEGKTTVAIQLALSLAKNCHQRVLLIDADLRAPDVHRSFGRTLDPGLCHVLRGEFTLDAAALPSGIAQVDVLTAGRLDCSPHELLTNESLQKLLVAARAQYQYIVFDVPPLLCASEALVIAKIADGTLLCTMRNRSRAEQFRSACNRLSIAGIRPLGTVFSGVTASDYTSRYGYQRGREQSLV